MWLETTWPTSDRFWSKVDASGDCWNWIAARMKNGYGVYNRGGSLGTSLAHRHAWEILVGPIPDGLQIDHLCRNLACVNPDHLEPVNQITNLARGNSPIMKNVNKTRCPKGHKYDWLYYRAKKDRWEKRCSQCWPGPSGTYILIPEEGE